MASTKKRSRNRMETTTEEPKSKWSHEQTLQFIELYKQHTHLWDRSHPNYRRPAPRRVSLEEIGAALDVPVSALSTKIHRLQTKFNSYFRKKMQMAPDEATVEVNNWPYFEELRFLEKSYRILDNERGKKPAKRSVRTKKSTVRSASKSDSDFNGFPKVEQHAECIISDADEEDLSDGCYIACSTKIASTNDSYGASSNATTKYEQMMPTSTTVTAAPLSAMNASNAQSNDRIDAFFKAMADTVKSFPNKNIAEVKLRISQIIGEMELTLASEEEVLVANF